MPSDTDPFGPITTSPLFQKVMKNGRSTGVTNGIVNGLKHVNLGEDENKLPNVWVLAVVGEGEGRFSEKGDSGSIVVNESGEMVGLLHSGHLFLDISYLTPYDVPAENIKKVTGIEVVWN
jgi:hypothetical protein